MLTHSLVVLLQAPFACTMHTESSSSHRWLLSSGLVRSLHILYSTNGNSRIHLLMRVLQGCQRSTISGVTSRPHFPLLLPVYPPLFPSSPKSAPQSRLLALSASSISNQSPAFLCRSGQVRLAVLVLMLRTSLTLLRCRTKAPTSGLRLMLIRQRLLQSSKLRLRAVWLILLPDSRQ